MEQQGTEHSVHMIDTEPDDGGIDGRVILIFAVIGLVSSIRFTCRMAWRLGSWCCQRSHRQITLADMVATAPELDLQERQALLLENSEQHSQLFEDTLLNTDDESETIPATDSMLERTRQIPQVKQRARASGPIYLAGSAHR